MIDAHAHLSDLRLESDAELLIAKLQSLGLRHVVLGGVEPNEWQYQQRLKSRWPMFVTSVVGIHPWTVRDQDEASLEKIFSILGTMVHSAEAVGEVGVDFYPKRLPEQVEKQSRWCRRQLELAKDIDKPVVLHIVRGHDVMQNLLKAVELPMAMIHGFKGNFEVAKFYLERGYVLSLGSRSFLGANLEDYRWLPKNAFVLESDAPPWTGEVTNSEKMANDWLGELNVGAQFLAKLWSIDKDEVWSLAKTNLTRLFPKF
jgi:TatD DNase family protein